MVPLLVLFLPPRTVIPVALMVGTVLNLSIALRERESLQAKRIVPLIVSGVFGIPLGMVLLLVLDGDVIRLIIGIVICTTGLLLMAGLYLKIKREKLALIPVGFISGILNGAISMSGPPVVLLFSNQKLRKGNFRANLVTYFIVLNILTYPIFLLGGLFTWDVLILSGVVMPGLVTGLFLGLKLTGRLDEFQFRRMALILVVVTGISALASGLHGTL